MGILLIRMKGTELLVLVLVLVMRASSSSSVGAETEQRSILRTLSHHLGFVTLPSMDKVTLPLRVSQIVRWSLGQQCFQANISADEFSRKYKIYRQSVLQTKRFELRSQIETSQQPHRSHNIPVHIGR